jgi:branched-chain amino acid aminotransferase
MSIATKMGIPVTETDLDLRDLHLADEVFLTSTSLCICPVGRIDGKDFSEPVPGPITLQLLTAYSEWVGLDIREQYRSFG